MPGVVAMECHTAIGCWMHGWMARTPHVTDLPAVPDMEYILQGNSNEN
jgi:hypothetical protein